MSIKLEATTTVTTAVRLETRAQQLILQRCHEHAKLAATVKELKGTKKAPGRMKRIEGEIAELFTKAKQGKALAEGTELSGYKIKMVIGKTRKFDQRGFMLKHGLSQADFDAFTEYNDNDPYVRITAPGEADDEY